jgi:hypothetical protein
MGGTVVGSVAGVAIAVFVIVYLVVILGSLAMMVVAIVDMARRPDWQWKIAGQERILWLLLVILVNLLAIPSLIYWFNVRPKLIAVEEAAARGAYGAGHMTYAGWAPGPPVPSSYAVAPAGWQPDPQAHGQFRWWDGTRWTEQTWGQTPAATGTGQ